MDTERDLTEVLLRLHDQLDTLRIAIENQTAVLVSLSKREERTDDGWPERLRLFLRSGLIAAQATTGKLTIVAAGRVIKQRFSRGHLKHAGKVFADEGYLRVVSGRGSAHYIQNPERRKP